jgi:hypothetical protein
MKVSPAPVEVNGMAEQPVNKSALVREYLAKYPGKAPTELAQQITREKGVPVTAKYVNDIKFKDKAKKTPASAKPGSAPARAEPAPTTPPSPPAPAKQAAARAEGVAQHIANLKAAAQRLGKDEAKRIIDLF